MQTEITTFLQKYIGISDAIQSKLFTSILSILILWILYKLLKHFVIEYFDDNQMKFRLRKIFSYSIAAIGFIILSKVWFGAFTGITTYLGLLSAGIAIALQDPLVNIAAWFFLTIRRPFKIGDRIQVGEIMGDVIDIRIFQFTLVEIRNWIDADQSTGRFVHLPNSMVFKSPQMNYTAGFNYIWEEIPVLITFESNWRKTKNILTEIVNKHAQKFNKDAEREIKNAAKKYLIHYNKLTPIVYTDVKNSGVLLTMRFLCKVRERRNLNQNIWEDILDEFAKHSDIDLAYPTTRYYNNLAEGKPGFNPEKE